MTVLGMRCSNSDYTFCLLSGVRDSPTVDETSRISFPKDYNEPELLNWLYQEITALFKRVNVDAVGVKKAEGTVKRSNALETRIKCEGIISLVAAQSGCGNVYKKINSTIAKDLGLKGKGKYLKTKLDTTAIADFEDYPHKARESILVAWSCM